MSNEQIKHMVDRFLQWKLPENFNPDGGISFKKTFNENAPWGPMTHEPVGTNLFDAVQAEEMVRYMVNGLPAERGEPAAEPPLELQREGLCNQDEPGHIGLHLLSQNCIDWHAVRVVPAAPAPAAPLEHIHRYDLEGKEGEYWYQCEYCGSTLPWPDAKDIVERNARLSAELEQVKAERDIANRHAADLFKRLQAAEAALGEKGKQ